MVGFDIPGIKELFSRRSPTDNPSSVARNRVVIEGQEYRVKKRPSAFSVGNLLNRAGTTMLRRNGSIVLYRINQGSLIFEMVLEVRQRSVELTLMQCKDQAVAERHMVIHLTSILNWFVSYLVER